MSHLYSNAESNSRRLSLEERWETLMSRFRRRPRRKRGKAIEIQHRESVPLALAGKWIAWSPDGLRIVLSANTLKEVCAEAKRLGYEDLIYEGIPRHFRNRGVEIDS